VVPGVLGREPINVGRKRPANFRSWVKSGHRSPIAACRKSARRCYRAWLRIMRALWYSNWQGGTVACCRVRNGGQMNPIESVNGSSIQGSVGSSDGTRIGFTRVGSGPSLVFVHGSLSTSEDWLPVARLLADRFACYVMDRRGRGGERR
jgi:hypothetical protein